jgi:prepilin-type N-terminal cleavage/methylation domain-containing protein
MKPKAFTLIELLVVIAIIALLLAILMPSLTMAKKKAASIACMTNVKNLSFGWYMYQQDNDDKIMSARMGGQSHNGDWVPGWIDWPYHPIDGLRTSSQITPAVTDDDEIRGIEDGALHPYIKSPKSYSCPADKVKSIYDGTEKYVTYVLASGLASNHSEKPVYKFGTLRSPSSKFNFLEVAEQRNFCGGMFVFGTPDMWNTGGDYCVWWNPVAINHVDTSTMGFCDGHAEKRKWREEYTFERVAKLGEQGGGAYGIDRNSGHNSTNDEDLRYLAQSWPGLK